ncbi:MAG: energy transducer TonB [Bacteroidales bacterium]|nr:energy transducer TonB [Bacteroidales bacterium]
MKNFKKHLSFFPAIFFLLATLCCQAQIDRDPEPYGGNLLMRDFICDEMSYPEAALEDKAEGTVEVAFTVMTDGKKIDHRIVQSLTPELDAEALRICKLIMYYPAVQSSNKIIADVVVPVKFNIKKYKRHCKKKGFDDYIPYQGDIDTSLIIYASRSLDKMPTPAFKDPGMTFPAFIMNNLKYPDLAYRQNITGEVELSFVVETSGRISNIEIVKPLGGGCTEEAIQLLKKILWKPGIKNGQAVRSFMTASINFSLDNNSNHKYLPNNNNTTM